MESQGGTSGTACELALLEEAIRATDSSLLYTRELSFPAGSPGPRFQVISIVLSSNILSSASYLSLGRRCLVE